MRYTFPKITHIDQIREAIAGRNEFIEAEREGYRVFNYLVNMPDTFPAVDSEQAALLRECRGLTFYDDGTVAARKYHKFFNAGERKETEARKIDISKKHWIMEKLDGSMITPYSPDGILNVDAQNLRFHTKMGDTDVAAPVNDFVKKNPHYANWCGNVIANNRTPIFEWCSRKQRIVIDYPQDRLVLTAIRDNESGEYIPYDELIKAVRSQIDVVGVHDFDTSDFNAFMEQVRSMEDMEGFVIRFDDGHMLKVKNEWYCALHKAVSAIAQEKDVWRMVLMDNADDVKAFLSEDDRERLDDFQSEIMYRVGEAVAMLEGVYDSAVRDINHRDWSMFENADREKKKMFAVEHVNADYIPPELRGVLFAAYDGKNIREAFIDWAVSNTSTGPKLDKMRYLFDGLSWDENYQVNEG